MGDGKLKLKRGSNRGVQVAGVKVSEGSIKGNTEQIHQLCKRAEHNLCFYPFTWAVAKGHTDNMVYMRISLNKNSVHALEMLQVSPAAVKGWEWRGEKSHRNQNYRMKDKHLFTNMQDSFSSDTSCSAQQVVMEFFLWVLKDVYKYINHHQFSHKKIQPLPNLYISPPPCSIYKGFTYLWTVLPR